MPIDPHRIAIPPLPQPGPQFLAGIVNALPIWALTSQQPELRRSLAGLLLAQGPNQPDFAAAAKGLLAYGCQFDPFDAPSLALLARTQAEAPFLPPRAAGMAGLLAGLPNLDNDDISFEAIRASGDDELLARYLEVSARDRAAGLARLAPAFGALCRLPDAEQAEGLLAAFAPLLPPPLFARLTAEFAVLRLPPQVALDRLATLDTEIWGLFAAVAASHCLDRLGDRGGALAACLAARRALPCHVNLTLRAFELARPVSAPLPAKAGEAAVCLYSLNKAELFHDCLQHLAQTDLGEAIIAVLDNGSTDATPDMLAGMAGRFPADRFVSVRLPVNIGAPGARNWLLALPEVVACRHVAFLDDDAFPETDWLSRLLATARDYPASGAVGCAITDMDAPRDHQSADFNLFPPDMGQPSMAEVKERLFVCEPCRGAPDLSLFAYARPCLSVSGCCHLLSRQALEKAGPFDIRFNPTQFDDLERDIRSFLAGYPCVYDGTVRVAHKQGSSLAKAQTQAQVSQVLGNKIKLEYAVSDADADRLWRENLALIGRDLLEKANVVDGL
ncbi:glycosyltransferase family 2 protein [Desulfovibrio sp. TomC]|uniref:glycosyltransferase family 2 protein n=1 Tax=Desulfovibrio sp. TomC TaxID=1562888 RepID=UPI000573113E|nr:glycosyltransferase [Desulfovibrio sp. TomC]KHK04130.1 Glycosyl transferase, group 2 family protein [Desulfovibrio sp. TomC]